MDFGRLELKLHEVHFAGKFSEAEAEDDLTAKCTVCSFNPMSMRRLPSTPSRACEARCTWQFPSGHWGRVGEDALSTVRLNISTLSSSFTLPNKYFEMKGSIVTMKPHYFWQWNIGKIQLTLGEMHCYVVQIQLYLRQILW